MATKFSEISAADMRSAMIDSQLRTNGITEAWIVKAMGELPREKFLPAGKEAFAYLDRSVSLGNGRMLNPPLATAEMLQIAEVSEGDNVLLIGAGTGYLAALLSDRVKKLVAVESDAELAKAARADDGTRLVGEQLFRSVALRRRLRHDLDAYRRRPRHLELRQEGFLNGADLVGKPIAVLQVNITKRRRRRATPQHATLGSLLGHDQFDRQAIVARIPLGLVSHALRPQASTLCVQLPSTAPAALQAWRSCTSVDPVPLALPQCPAPLCWRAAQ